ncbi:MAG: hypothetical protein ACTSRG_01510 [Candidatus Helarchaeota archaeon]
MYLINMIQKNHEEIWNNLHTLIPFMKPWVKQQRWAGLSEVESFNLVPVSAIKLKNEMGVKIIGFIINIYNSDFSYKIFLPLIFYSGKQWLDIPLEIVVKTQNSEIYLSQAECSPIFIKLLIENFIMKKKYKIDKNNYFEFELENEELLKDYDFVNSEAFKKGETTNFLTKIAGKRQDLLLKSYRRFSNSREPILIKELFRAKFENLPKPIGFAKISNRNGKICFYLQEFILFTNDLGFYFWNYLNRQIINPESRCALINHANLNQDILKTVSLLIKFHQKTANLDNPLFKKVNFTKKDIENFKNFQQKITNEILKHKDENLNIYNGISNKFDRIQKDTDDLEHFIGFDKITVHQDLHLGQILVKDDELNNKFLYITDLEGDPNRSNNEVWDRDLIFRDLSSLITAFHYIAIDNIIKTTTLTKEKLKNFEKFSDAKSILKSSEPVNLASEFTDYTTKQLIELYFTQFRKTFQYGKNIDLSLFKKGCEIYEYDRIIREIHYELKYRKGNFVVPLTILNNLF